MYSAPSIITNTVDLVIISLACTTELSVPSVLYVHAFQPMEPSSLSSRRSNQNDTLFSAVTMWRLGSRQGQ